MIKLFKEYYYNGIKTEYLVSNTGEVYSIRYKKSEIIKILNNKYGGDYKHIVYNYGR